VFSWFVFIFVYANIYRLIQLPFFIAGDWYGILEGYQIFLTAGFWLTVLLTTVVALLRDFTFKAWNRLVSQELYYEAIRVGKNVDREAVMAGFPIEEGLPIKLKDKTVKGLIDRTVVREFKEIVPEKYTKKIEETISDSGLLLNSQVEIPEEQPYSGFAFSAPDNSTFSIMRGNFMSKEKMKKK
jgi:hypothetical protein